jgi:crossover junction endodeoxyribonuclease RuvC
VVEKNGNRVRHLSHGCIETSPRQAHAQRLLQIYQHIKAVIAQWGPASGAVETLYFAKNVKSAMPVAEARGVLCMAMAEAGLSVYEYSPATIKLAITGVARAEKTQVQEMTRLILGLEKTPSPNHAADALGAAICCANTALLGPA